MKMLKYIGPADYITIINGLIGFLAIMFIIDNNYRIAFIFILIVIILDGIDGWLARYLKSTMELGKYLDSISDTISFSFAPAVLIYSIFYNLNYNSFNYWPNSVVVFSCFIIVGFGMVRLAWFVEYGQNLKSFQGLPTPALAFFVIVLLQPQFQSYLNPITTLGLILLVALLTVTDFEYPKFDNMQMQAAGGLVVILVILDLVFDFSVFASNMIILSAFAALILYIAAGPFRVRMKRFQLNL